MVQLPKLSQTLLMTSMLLSILTASSSFASTIFMHKTAYAQKSNSNSNNSNSGFGGITYLALPNGKTIPIKYIINTGKLLGVVLDKSRATLTAIISSPSSSDNGNLTIQIPRGIVDDKKTR